MQAWPVAGVAIALPLVVFAAFLFRSFVPWRARGAHRAARGGPYNPRKGL